MQIYLNPHCDYGKGWRKWKKIEPELRKEFGNFSVEEIISPNALGRQVKFALKAGKRIFIAAGGDGTVNLLLNALMNSSTEKENILFGTIGLGSSNDFHKPFRPEAVIKGVPLRMNFQKAILSDVICVQYRNFQNRPHTRYCLINASIGIAAQANAIYNSRISWIEFIQKISIEAAILASALKTILTFKNIPCQIELNGTEPRSFRLTNLGVIKNPHFAGGMCYDTPIQPDDGKLGVNLCNDMTIGEAVGTLIKLYKQQFQGRPKTQTYSTKNLTIKSNQQFALEMDGEVVHTNQVKFEVIPKAMRCCS
jgi:diacylglycerol kinase (ATP)